MAEIEYSIERVAGAKAVRRYDNFSMHERKIVTVTKVTPAGWVYVGTECFRPRKHGDMNRRFSPDASLDLLTPDLVRELQNRKKRIETYKQVRVLYDRVGHWVYVRRDDVQPMERAAKLLQEIIDVLEKESASE